MLSFVRSMPSPSPIGMKSVHSCAASMFAQLMLVMAIDGILAWKKKVILLFSFFFDGLLACH